MSRLTMTPKRWVETDVGQPLLLVHPLALLTVYGVPLVLPVFNLIVL